VSDVQEGPRRARPAYNRDNAFFAEGLQAGKFRIQRCTQCDTLRAPPRPMCSNCLSLDWEIVEAAGKGTIYSYATHHYPALQGIDTPCPVVLVELDEGVRAIGNLVDGTEADLAIGKRVTFTVRDEGEGNLLPQWTPEKSR
jgi:uncharacterized OB-fold protein